MWWFLSYNCWLAIPRWRHGASGRWLEEQGWPIVREDLSDSECISIAEWSYDMFTYLYRGRPSLNFLAG